MRKTHKVSLDSAVLPQPRSKAGERLKEAKKAVREKQHRDEYESKRIKASSRHVAGGNAVADKEERDGPPKKSGRNLVKQDTMKKVPNKNERDGSPKKSYRNLTKQRRTKTVASTEERGVPPNKSNRNIAKQGATISITRKEERDGSPKKSNRHLVKQGRNAVAEKERDTSPTKSRVKSPPRRSKARDGSPSKSRMKSTLDTSKARSLSNDENPATHKNKAKSARSRKKREKSEDSPKKSARKKKKRSASKRKASKRARKKAADFLSVSVSSKKVSAKEGNESDDPTIYVLVDETKNDPTFVISNNTGSEQAAAVAAASPPTLTAAATRQGASRDVKPSMSPSEHANIVLAAFVSSIEAPEVAAGINNLKSDVQEKLAEFAMGFTKVSRAIPSNSCSPTENEGSITDTIVDTYNQLEQISSQKAKDVSTGFNDVKHKIVDKISELSDDITCHPCTKEVHEVPLTSDERSADTALARSTNDALAELKAPVEVAPNLATGLDKGIQASVVLEFDASKERGESVATGSDKRDHESIELKPEDSKDQGENVATKKNKSAYESDELGPDESKDQVENVATGMNKTVYESVELGTHETKEKQENATVGSDKSGHEISRTNNKGFKILPNSKNRSRRFVHALSLTKEDNVSDEADSALSARPQDVGSGIDAAKNHSIDKSKSKHTLQANDENSTKLSLPAKIAYRVLRTVSTRSSTTRKVKDSSIDNRNGDQSLTGSSASSLPAYSRTREEVNMTDSVTVRSNESGLFPSKDSLDGAPKFDIIEKISEDEASQPHTGHNGSRRPSLTGKEDHTLTDTLDTSFTEEFDEVLWEFEDKRSRSTLRSPQDDPNSLESSFEIESHSESFRSEITSRYDDSVRERKSLSSFSGKGGFEKDNYESAWGKKEKAFPQTDVEVTYEPTFFDEYDDASTVTDNMSTNTELWV